MLRGARHTGEDGQLVPRCMQARIARMQHAHAYSAGTPVLAHAVEHMHQVGYLQHTPMLLASGPKATMYHLLGVLTS